SSKRDWSSDVCSSDWEFCNFLITSAKIVGGIDVVENDEYIFQKDFATFQYYLKGIFLGKFGDDEWLPPRRPTAWWYSDVTLALSSYLEAPQVALLLRPAAAPAGPHGERRHGGHRPDLQHPRLHPQGSGGLPRALSHAQAAARRGQ